MLEIETMIHEAYVVEQEKNNPWHDSPYRDLINLTIDARGKIGEAIVSKALHQIENSRIIIEEDYSDINIKGNNAHYDMRINGLNIEIKTAYRGKNGSWQHENLYRSAADMTIFVDFDTEGIYFSVIPEELLPLDDYNSLFGNRKKATLRQNKDDGYKFDFSATTHKTLAAHGDKYAKFFIADEASLTDIGSFISERILDYVDSF
jgi:hypothetical protein